MRAQLLRGWRRANGAQHSPDYEDMRPSEPVSLRTSDGLAQSSHLFRSLYGMRASGDERAGDLPRSVPVRSVQFPGVVHLWRE